MRIEKHIPDCHPNAAKTQSEIDIADKEATIAAEQAYRRGFTQGIAATIRAIEAGRTESEIDDWYDRVLRQWRYANHRGRFDPPKELA